MTIEHTVSNLDQHSAIYVLCLLMWQGSYMKDKCKVLKGSETVSSSLLSVVCLDVVALPNPYRETT